MINTIKRQGFCLVTRNIETTQILESKKVFASWYTEIIEKNRFFYRFSNRLQSLLYDALIEQDLVTSKFIYRDLDYTKPYYATVVNRQPQVTTNILHRQSGQDWLFNDIHGIGVKILNSREDKERQRQRLLALTESGVLDLSLNDINESLTKLNDPDGIILDLWRDGEIILSGSIVAPTTKGAIARFDETAGLYENVPAFINTVTSDTDYLIVSPFVDIDTFKFSDSGTSSEIIINNTLALVGRFQASGNYKPEYDVDNDGYISPEDIQFVRESIGRTIENTIESKWASMYAKFDKKLDGVISEEDVIDAEGYLGEVRESCTIIRNPLGHSAITARYVEYSRPYSTYVSNNTEVEGGSYGLDNLLNSEQVSPSIADGFHENDNGIILGINIALNEIWVGRRTDLGWALKRTTFPGSDYLLVKGMTVVDDIVFILVQSSNDRKLFGESIIALVRFETRKESIEISTDVIPIVGVDLIDDEEVTGICSSNRKDIFRIFTNKKNIIKIQTSIGAIVNMGALGVLAAQSAEEFIRPANIISKISLLNDLDTFGFNLGIDRGFSFGNEPEVL